MSAAIFSIGPVPYNESCATIEQKDYYEKATIECMAFSNQLMRQFEPLPQGVNFKIVSVDHEFGKYLEVAIAYDDKDSVNLEFVNRVEIEANDVWDNESEIELGMVKI